uniref:Uncharacterized protein n=1 Tax=Rhizophora mucronata TaxID=61149 RepID=A0A2P2NWV0_RHIMU
MIEVKEHLPRPFQHRRHNNHIKRKILIPSF